MPTSRPRSSPRPPSRRAARFRVALWRARHAVAATALGLAAALAVQHLAPPEPLRVDVLVAARDLTATQELTASDVRVVALPPEAVPPDAVHDAAAVVGERLAHAVPEGHPLSPRQVLGPGLADDAPPGTVLVPVRLADPVLVTVLEEGTSVDLVAADADGAAARVLARGAVVVARLAPADAGTTGLLGGSGSPQESPLLVAVPPDVATLVVEASARGTLTLLLVPPR